MAALVPQLVPEPVFAPEEDDAKLELVGVTVVQIYDVIIDAAAEEDEIEDEEGSGSGDAMTAEQPSLEGPRSSFVRIEVFCASSLSLRITVTASIAGVLGTQRYHNCSMLIRRTRSVPSSSSPVPDFTSRQ